MNLTPLATFEPSFAKGKIAALNRQPDQSRRRIEIRFIPPGKTR